MSRLQASRDDDPEQGTPPRATGLREIVYWTLAALFFVLAMIGIVLPGIPTTPLLLVMCFFLIRVSPRLHEKAMRWPVVGAPLRAWRDKGGVTVRVKIIAVTMVVVLVGGTLLVSRLAWYLELAIVLAAAYGVFVILRLKTVR